MKNSGSSSLLREEEDEDDHEQDVATQPKERQLIHSGHELRRGELLGLRWRDVDLDRGQFAVTGSLQGTTRPTLVIGSPKSGGAGAVALGPAGCVRPP